MTLELLMQFLHPVLNYDRIHGSQLWRNSTSYMYLFTRCSFHIATSFSHCFDVVSFFLIVIFFSLKTNTIARLAKAVRMIIVLESFDPSTKKPSNGSLDIEIKDDEPKQKPSWEETGALEVQPIYVYLIGIKFLVLNFYISSCVSRKKISSYLTRVCCCCWWQWCHCH